MNNYNLRFLKNTILGLTSLNGHSKSIFVRDHNSFFCGSNYSRMTLEPLLNSLLLILQLPEFLGPKQLCFIIDSDDLALHQLWNAVEYFGSHYVCSLTCERFDDAFSVTKLDCYNPVPNLLLNQFD